MNRTLVVNSKATIISPDFSLHSFTGICSFSTPSEKLVTSFLVAFRNTNSTDLETTNSMQAI